MPRRLQVHAHLMGTAGLQARLHQGEVAKALHRAEVRDGLLAAHRHHGLTCAPTWVAANGAVHRECGRELPVHQRQIAPLDVAVAHHAAEPPVRAFGAGHQHEPRGIAVEPVHDARPVGVVPTRDARTEQPVHQGALVVPLRRVRHHPGGFVDHHDVLVGEHDGHVERFRAQFPGGPRLGPERRLNHVPGGQAVPLRLHLAVHQHVPGVNQALRLGAALHLVPLGEHGVEAPAHR